MRLKSLYIKEYKNIKDQTFDFSLHNGITLLIGNNGSGKSNLIESISDIFSNLYQDSTSFETKEFTLSYIDNDNVIYSVKYSNGVLTKEVDGESTTLANPLVLPKRVVAVYSGETTRLWNKFYRPIYENIVSQINSTSSFATLQLPRMIYLNHFYWDLSLLSLLCSEAEDIKTFCHNEIGITGAVYFEFNYATQDDGHGRGYHSYTGSRILEFVKSFDKKQRYTISQFINCIEKAEFNRGDIFELLYCAYTPKDGKIITNIKVEFNNGLSVADLSEGLKKRILIRSALEFAGQENSIYLLDEPDAHIHLGKKKKVIEDINPYKDIKHIIMTSHSPTMCKYVGKDNPNSIIMLDNGEQKSVGDLFEAGRLMSDDDSVFNLLFTTKHIVLTEGKTDCKYIEKAIKMFKNEYPILYNDVEFISVGGTDGEVINDLLPRITDIENRKIIVLVDRDSGGLKCARMVLEKENLSKANIDIKPIETKMNAFFIMIPSIDGKQMEFVIEDYFGHDTLQQLSFEYIRKQFVGKNFSGFPKVKEDLKKNVIPNFCEKSINPDDFKGFKVLLNKLNDCLN